MSINDPDMANDDGGNESQQADGGNDSQQAQPASTMADGEQSDGHVPAGHLPIRGGGFVRVHYDVKDVKPVYLDEYTREALPHALVMEAIKEELEYVNQRVWKLDDASAVLKDQQSKTIRTRWVICNKGDASSPEIRARLVACEDNTFKSDVFRKYAATGVQETPLF